MLFHYARERKKCNVAPSKWRSFMFVMVYTSEVEVEWGAEGFEKEEKIVRKEYEDKNCGARWKE